MATLTLGGGQEAGGGLLGSPREAGSAPRAAWTEQEAPAFPRFLRQMHRMSDRGAGG